MLDDLEKRCLVVKVGLEIGRIDGDQTLRGRGDLIHSSANLGQRCQNR